MKNTLDTVAIAGMKGLGVASLILAINKPSEPIRAEIFYPMALGRLALTTYFIGREIYESFREASRTFNHHKKR